MSATALSFALACAAVTASAFLCARESLHARTAWCVPGPIGRAPSPTAALIGRDLDSLDARLIDLKTAAARGGDPRVAFRATRSAYKRAEALLSGYGLSATDALNSNETMPFDEDIADGFKIPRGFQLLEPMVFADHARAGREQDQFVTEVDHMRLAVSRFRPNLPFIVPTDADLAKVARFELARVSTLGIAGFDVAASGDAIRESADAVDGIAATLCTAARPDSAAVTAMRHLADALRAQPDFDSFDRYTFVRDQARPAFDAIASFAKRSASTARPGPPRVRLLWPDSIANVYDVRHFDVLANAPSGSPANVTDVPTFQAWTALGRELFFDPRLSGDETRSCATCHVPERGFTDGRPRALLRPGAQHPSRHTPSLIGAAFQPFQFADERAGTIEGQVEMVITNPAEMGGSMDSVVARLGRDPQVREAFAAVTAKGSPRLPSPVPLTSVTVRAAIASYIRTLTGVNSAFDRAMRGEGELDPAARRGFNLFMGRAACGTCHFAPLFNGAIPPWFVDDDPEVTGVPATQSTGRPVIDQDSGRGAIDTRSGLVHAFKTPSVRAAALGGPYMHNGVFATLDALLDFYDRGGGVGAGNVLPNQTLSPTPLHLTTTDRADLAAFLRALVDTAGLTLRPTVRAP